MGRLEIGIDKADRDAASEAFWALEYADSWKQLQGDTFYAWPTTRTSGGIVSIAKALGRGNIWNLRKDIYEDYGAGTSEDLQGMEKEFDKALYRGKPMRLCDSMPEYLTYVTEMHGDLCKTKQQCHYLINASSSPPPAAVLVLPVLSTVVARSSQHPSGG
jgi:hypothetical protein